MVDCSPLYRTAPVGGPPGQEDYINAVCRVQTDLSARQLLATCLDIENKFGRDRGERWGPRTLDIDLLLYDDARISEPNLVVPHPRMRERLFVLAPLADIAPASLKIGPDDATLGRDLKAALEAAGETIEDWKRRVTD
jgi:2-amino-4-hydroxy-6-hydroxymethyldihydropteridine diphosphokinase